MIRWLFVGLVLLAAFIALIWAGQFGYGPIVVVQENESKVVLRFGSPVKTLAEPGISWKIPVLDNVEVFDSRLQYLNAKPVEMLISRGEKLIIDYYAVWEISNPLEFMRNFPGHIPRAEERIQETVNALVGAKIGGLELTQLLQRAEILGELESEANAKLAGTGVHVVDVRLNRVELPRNAEPAAYAQMREQRRAISREHRVRGERDARRIRAEAERGARRTVAEAHSDSERIKGEGDAESARIYAEAYGRDPEFYAFVRSLEAYRKTLGERTTMVLPPDHDFFKYLAPQDGGARGKGRVSAPPPRPARPPAPLADSPPAGSEGASAPSSGAATPLSSE